MQWSANGATALELLTVAVDGLATRLATRYAQRLNGGAAGNGVMITVRDVNNLTDYARTMAYLQSLDLVRRVQVVMVSDSQLALRAFARSDRQGLAQAIAFGGTLAVVVGNEVATRPVDAASQQVAAPRLSYRLLP